MILQLEKGQYKVVYSGDECMVTIKQHPNPVTTFLSASNPVIEIVESGEVEVTTDPECECKIEFQAEVQQND